MIPRADQLRAVDAALAEIGAGSSSIIICIPPGGGKTLVAYLLITHPALAGRRWWFAAHRRGLVTQPAAKFREYSAGALHPAVLMAGHEYDPCATLKVASIQTLLQRDITPEPGDAVIVDECHLAHVREIMRTTPGVLWLGLTGTPETSKGAPLGDSWQTMVLGARPSELVAAGAIRDPRVITWPLADGAAPTDPRVVGDAVREWQANAWGLRTLAFCVNRHHARSTVRRYAVAGVRARYVDGETPEDERARALAALEAREIDVLVNVRLYTEGTDLPWLECIQDLTPRLSLAQYLQAASRVARADRSKVDCLHLCHAGNPLRWGTICEDHPWELRRSQRQATLVDAPRVTRCAACGAVLAGPGTCWRCGRTVAAAVPRDVPVGRGTLTELDRAELARARLERKEREAREQQQRRVLRGIAYGRLPLAMVSRTAARWWHEFQQSKQAWGPWVAALERGNHGTH